MIYTWIDRHSNAPIITRGICFLGSDKKIQVGENALDFFFDIFIILVTFKLVYMLALIT